VPAGVSGWELGVEKSVLGKANGDYEKRSDAPDGLNPSESAFVFVTPRWFRDKAKWTRECRAKGPWREIRAYDCDDLMTWLEHAPAVHVWLSMLLGKMPEGVRSLDEAWTGWSEASDPPLPTALTLGGRDQAAATVAEWLTGPAELHVIRADSPEEALGFICAVGRSLPADNASDIAARTIVVDTLEAWRVATQMPGRLILVPTFVPASGAILRSATHATIVPTTRSSPAADQLDLPRVRRDAAAAALEAMGFEKSRASDLATEARRGLLGMRRRLAVGAVIGPPPWAQQDRGAELLPVMLAGSWREDWAGDRDALAKLAGQPYEDFSTALATSFNATEPPLRRDGQVILLTSPTTTWAHLQGRLSAPQIERFRSVCEEVLGAKDPALDLPRDVRWAAAVHGLTRTHSEAVRTGMAETLVRLALCPEVIGRTGQELTDAIARDLLGPASRSADTKAWVSLRDILPALAEAAPTVFLDAVERGLSGDEPLFSGLFTDGSDQWSITSPSPDYTATLWALELVAWQPQYLPRSSIALARLAALDPGGHWSNRPRGSLKQILNPLVPHTKSGPEQRLEVIDSVRRLVPSVAWALLRDLLPDRGDVLSVSQRPRVRDWELPELPSVTFGEAISTIRALVDCAIAEAGTDAARWAQLVSSLDELPPDSRGLVLEALERVEPRDLDGGLADLLARCRDLTAHYRRYPDAQRRLSEAEIVRLERFQQGLVIENLPRRHAWLFSHRPPLDEPFGNDWRAYQAAADERRGTAVSEVWEHGQLAELGELARLADVAGLVGDAAARLQLSEAEEAALLGYLPSDDRDLASLAGGWVAARHRADGWPWSDEVLGRHSQAWGPDLSAAFLANHRAEGPTWDRVERLGDETRTKYWSTVWPAVVEPGAPVRRAAAELLAVGRSHLALDLLAMHRETLVDADFEMVCQTLEAAARTKPDPAVGPPIQTWDVSRLMDFIESFPGEGVGRVVSLEWMYLPLLAHEERPARLLHQELSQDPAFFVEVVTWVFRGSKAEEELSEQDRSRARHGWELLESWHHVPGASEGGSLDGPALRDWVDAARSGLGEAGRADIGDQQIGRVLRYAPAGQDGIWPAEEVRDLLEELRAEHVEIGLAVEIRNSRGVTSRGLTEGGAQERTLADQYRRDAEALATRWPRTSSLLARLADSYTREARGHDDDADLTEDTW